MSIIRPGQLHGQDLINLPAQSPLKAPPLPWPVIIIERRPTNSSALTLRRVRREAVSSHRMLLPPLPHLLLPQLRLQLEHLQPSEPPVLQRREQDRCQQDGSSDSLRKVDLTLSTTSAWLLSPLLDGVEILNTNLCIAAQYSNYDLG